MSFDHLTCPRCGAEVKRYRNPVPTVDIIIETAGGIVLIERKNEPRGWALPGGFVDYGETLEAAAMREALEETSLHVTNLRLLGCYSDPARDPRQHTISTVYVAEASGVPAAADDAANLAVFPLNDLPSELCFDHRRILDDYLRFRERSSA
ncbi:NUDIX hydrolase [Geobacter metallireducens RCH3]|uniref:NUDIX hydrolase n=1 Tax=Geobacter metallireducens (strain ATCC 53774 / DSM 7210 / GS-15) TaxID=269799 RepID=Q39WZ4_GEOMG|nr:NUDIX hydrolase [Geobacter metallireducens]ABB31230.1 NUDIX hydrolase [Geobacter metallireducens GS-15]EHP84628.1 NUDIX hydrolase [Geobacter metallireducens RCH3]